MSAERWRGVALIFVVLAPAVGAAFPGPGASILMGLLLFGAAYGFVQSGIFRRSSDDDEDSGGKGEP